MYLYVIFVGTHSIVFLLDVIFASRIKETSALVDEIQNLRSSATFHVAMWSTVAVAEIALTWFEVIEYEKFGLQRVVVPLVVWVLKSVEAHLWGKVNGELEKECDTKAAEEKVESEKKEEATTIEIPEKQKSTIRRRKSPGQLSTISEEEELPESSVKAE